MLNNYSLKGDLSLRLIHTLPSTQLPALQVTTNLSPIGSSTTSLSQNGLSGPPIYPTNEGNSYFSSGHLILSETSDIKCITINPNPGSNEMAAPGLTGDKALSAKFTIAR